MQVSFSPLPATPLPPPPFILLDLITQIVLVEENRSEAPHCEFSYNSQLPRQSNQRDSSAPYSQTPPAYVPLSVLET